MDFHGNSFQSYVATSAIMGSHSRPITCQPPEVGTRFTYAKKWKAELYSEMVYVCIQSPLQVYRYGFATYCYELRWTRNIWS